jgi:hypothetical protein
MARCIVQLDSTQKLLLKGELQTSDFAFKLHDYYQGRSAEGAPDIKELAHYINDEIIPAYFKDTFSPQDAVNFLDTDHQEGVVNVNALTEALSSMLGTRAAANPQGLPNPDYVKKSSLVVDLVEQLAKDKVGSQIANQAVVKEEELKQDSASEGLIPVEQYKYQYLKKYNSLRAYRIGRFRGSSTTEAMIVSKFVNDVLIKQALINTDTKQLVSSDDVDTNLKEYRKGLLEDLVNRLGIEQSDKDGVRRMEYSNELLLSDNFDNAIKAIEQKVSRVQYHGESILLSDEGRLVEIGEELKRTNSPELQSVLQNYADHVILADFDKLFTYYTEGAISVSDFNDSFDSYTKKYGIAKKQSIDAANVNWTDKVHNGVDLAADLFKTIIENTPIHNFVTGLQTSEYLYPALISSSMARYYGDIDPQRGAASIKDVLIKAMNNSTNTYTDKNVLYTLYKKFFEEQGDSVKLHVNNIDNEARLRKEKREKVVSSYLDTIGRDGNQELMHLIMKPLQEIVKVNYVEGSEVNGQVGITLAGARPYTVANTNARADIARAINSLDEEGIKNLIDKYSIQFNSGSIDYNAPGSDIPYKLTAKGATEYSLDGIMRLSNDLLHIDVESNPAHREFKEELTARATGKLPLPNQYLVFLNDALKVLQARQMTFDPKLQEKLASKNGDKTIVGSEVLMKAMQDTNFNFSDPSTYQFEVNGVAAQEMYNVLADSQNRYSGNRVKGNTVTIDGKSVAGFSTHTLGLGLPQTFQHDVNVRTSITGPDNTLDPLSNNPFNVDRNFLEPLQIKSAVKIGTQVKGNTAMSDTETLIFDINLGYFDNIKRSINKNTKVQPLFTPVTNSDKSTTYMLPVNNLYRGNAIFVDPSGIAIPEDVTRQLHFDSVGTFYRAYAGNIISDWRKVYTQVSPTAASIFDRELGEAKTYSAKLSALNDLNQVFWKTNHHQTEGFEHGLTGLQAARFYADKAEVPLNNWVHYQNNRKSMDNKSIPLATKQSLIDYVKLFDNASSRKGYDKYMDDLMIQSVKTLQGINYKFTDTTHSSIVQLYPNLEKRFYNRDTGEVFLRSNNSKEPVTRTSDINPAYRKFFNDFNFVSENFVNATVGSQFAHKGSSPYELLIAQTKRNVALTASMRKYTIGLENGVESHTRTAFMDDFTSQLKTVIGEEHQVVDNDGASLETTTQRLKTWNSLNSKYTGDGGPDHKSIFSDYNPKTGHFTLVKHAAFLMDHEMIRRSVGSDVDLMDLHKKLYATDISKVNITKSYKREVNLSHFLDTPLHYWDRTYDFDKGRAGHIYKLESIEFTGKNEKGESTYTVKKRNMSMAPDDLLQENNTTISTMYDLWRILGHIDSVEPTTSKTGLSYKDGADTIYFKPSIGSDQKLLEYESYMGNGGERMLPAEYITNRVTQDTPAWKEYQKLFGSTGVVDSHADLITKYAEMDPTSFDTHQLLGAELSDHDVKVSGAEFLDSVNKNKALFAGFFKRLRGQWTDEATVPYQRWKGKNIDRISFAGAVKVGQFNMNDTSTMSKRKLAEQEVANPNIVGKVIPGIHALMTHPVSNLNGGVQLNAWHEAEESTVTAPTQMLNALSFNGKSIEEVTEIYKALSDIVDKELTYALDDKDTGTKPKVNIPQLVRGLSNAEFYAQNKKTLLAVFHDLLTKNMKTDTFTLENLIKETFTSSNLPIDDTHIFNSAVADLANYFTKSGIRINFDGIFSVLAPSSGMLQFHDVKGGYLPVREGNGFLSYRALDPNKVTTLSRVDHANWTAYNEWLRSHPEAQVANAAINLHEGPRDLKGQQVTLTMADGSTRDLSILRAGAQHLIPEAEALSKVTKLISDYRKFVTHDGDSDYAKMNQGDKQDYLDFYIEDFNDKLSGLISTDAGVKHVHDSIVSDLVRFDPAHTPGDLLDVLYSKFNPNSGYRIRSTNSALAGEYDYFDKLNLVGKAFLGKLQDFLDVSATGEIPTSLKNKKLYVDQKSLKGAKVSVSRAECIAPITARTSFGLREGDDMGDIDREFFHKRLLEKLDYLDVKADGVLLSNNGRRYFLHTTRVPRDIVPSTNTKFISDDQWYTNANGEPVFRIPQGVTIVDRGGEVHAYVGGGKEANIIKLQSSLNEAFRDEDDRFPPAKMFGSTSTEKAELKAKAIMQAGHQANIQWASWQKYLEVIGTRIPGQHFQSFQGMKIIGFTEGNKIHIPHEVTLLSGSDFDIDKQNVIYHSVNKDGSIALWHPASRYDSLEAINKSMQLPLQQGRSADAFATSKDTNGNYIHPVMQGIDDNANTADLDVLNDIYTRLKNGFRLTHEDHPQVIEALVDYDNFRSQTLPDEADPYKLILVQPNNGVKGIKNFVISRTNATIENPSNFIYLSKPVSMDVPRLFADNSPKGEATKLRDMHLPESIAQGKQDNMVGKKVIGIMATGLKVLSAVSLTYNNELRRLNPLVNEMSRIKRSMDELSSDPINNKLALEQLQEQHTKYEASVNSVVNALRLDRIPLSKLKADQDGHGMDLLANLNYDKVSADTLGHVFSNLENRDPEISRILGGDYKVGNPLSTEQFTALKAYLKTRGTFEDDSAELMSQLLSAATDNAKELILAKINASPDLAGMYATMIMLKVPFEQIVDKMTSPLTEMLIRNGVKNIFDKGTAKNSISDLLTNAVTAASDPEANYAHQNLNTKYGIIYTSGHLVELKTGQRFPIKDINEMAEIANAAKEISLLGRMLSINQGVKSNTWDLFRFKSSIEDYVGKLIDGKFDFKEFLDSLGSDRGYADEMIDAVSDKKLTFNILQVLATNPHFAEQLKAYNAASTILGLSSYKVATAGRIVEKLRAMNYLGKYQSVDESQFRDIERFVENTILENFINEQTNRAISRAASPIFYDGDTILSLTTPEGQQRFANWMKDKFLPRIQGMDEYKGNPFIQNLTTDSKRDMLLNGKFGFVKLNVDTSGTKSLIQQGKEDSFSYGLKLLYDSKATDYQHPDDPTKHNNIVNALFWYNLILNKNNITKNSYAKVLGEVMGLGEGEQNAYRKLLELKGNIGKNEAYDPANEGWGMLISNGVTFELSDLFEGYDAFTSNMRYTGTQRSNEEDLGAEEVPDQQEEAEEQAIGEEATGGTGDEGASVDMLDTIDEITDEDDTKASTPKVTVNKTREYGTVGTKVDIFAGKNLVKSKFISVPSALIPHSSENRTKVTYHTEYNPLVIERNSINDTDAINFQKMQHMNMHDLLSSLQAKYDIEIEQRDGEKVQVSRFDATKSYDCI